MVYSKTGTGNMVTLDSSAGKMDLDINQSGLSLPFRKIQQRLRKQNEVNAT